MDAKAMNYSSRDVQSGGRYRFSVIVPVLCEQQHINSVIEHLKKLPGSELAEIIVVDGDPRGRTIKAITDKGVTAFTCEKGRGRQMNAGAAAANGETLIFLHADTRLPAEALEKVAQVLQDGRYVAGAFDLGIDSDRLVLRYIAARARLRSRLNRIPYGDQAIFMRKAYFDAIGRFREIPIMEDVDLMRRIKKRGDKIFILRDRVRTSPRRWEAEGAIYATVRNQFLVAMYYLGVSPTRLARFYKPHIDKVSHEQEG